MLNTPDIYPAFWRFAAVIGAVIVVAALAAVAGFIAAWKIFAPKKEDYEKGNIYGEAKSHSRPEPMDAGLSADGGRGGKEDNKICA